VDVEVLRIMQGAIASDVLDFQGAPSSRHKPAFFKLLQAITAKVTNDPEIWRIYASFQEQTGSKEEVLEQLLKAYRSTQIHGWEGQQDLFNGVARGAKDVVGAYLAVGGSGNIHAAKLLLKNILKKTEVTHHLPPKEGEGEEGTDKNTIN